MNPVVVALGYFFAGVVVVPLVLRLFRTHFEWIDIALAAIGGALASLIPTIGGLASLAAMLGVLYWRLGSSKLFPDIVVAVLIARLVLLPVFLLIQSGGSVTYAAVRRIEEHSMPCWHQNSDSSRGRNETRIADTSRRRRASKCAYRYETLSLRRR